MIFEDICTIVYFINELKAFVFFLIVKLQNKIKNT